MSDLKSLFADNPAPAPRADLADRIMAAAQATPPVPVMVAANDNHWLKWVGGMAAAAILGVFIWAQQPSEAENWQDYASTAGFSDLHAWVEADG